MMNKTNLLAIILFIAFGASFIILSFLLNIKPNNAILVKRKLKTGAILIILTAFFNGCAPRESDIISCYEPQLISDDTITEEAVIIKVEKDTLYQKFLKSAITSTKANKKKAQPPVTIDSIPAVDCYMEVPVTCYDPVDPIPDE